VAACSALPGGSFKGMGSVVRWAVAIAVIGAALLGASTASATTDTVIRLTNESSYTRWADPVETGPIYAAPNFRSRRVGRLRLETPEGYPEVYVLLEQLIEPEGEEWVRIRFAGRPNGKTGWVPRERLGTFQHTRWSITVNLAQRRMRVFYAGRLRRSFPVGVGKPSTPTPTGHFWVVERIPVPNRASPYWPYALGTSDYSTLSNWPDEGIVGIHGPYGDEAAIPGAPSHGCIRMRAADVAWLGPHVGVGTPIHVLAR